MRGLVALALLAALVAVVVRLVAGAPAPPPGSDSAVVLEPYRYVVRPIGVPATRARQPTSARATTPVRAGLSAAGLTVSTTEPRPQAVVYLPPAGLAAAGDRVDVAVEPLAPAPLPTGYRADGNRYRVSLVDPAGPVRLAPQGRFATVQLRATSERRRDAVLLARADDAAPWRVLASTRGPGGVYGAPLPGAGDVQLAVPSSAEPAGRSRVPVAVLGGAVLLLAVVVAGLRLRRAHPAQGS